MHPRPLWGPDHSVTRPLPHGTTQTPSVSLVFHAPSPHSLSDALQLRARNPVHLGQDTRPPSPTRGPYKPLQLRIPLPPSPGRASSLRSKPRTALPARALEP